MLFLCLAAAAAPVQETAAPVDFWQELRERLNFYGDMRLRYEGNYERDGQPDRNRGRARFRVGGALKVDEEFLVGARATSGNPDDPNSPHVDLGDGFHRDDFNLDRWFVEYTPDWWEGLTARGGKFAHPFYSNPIYGEYIWDADVQPEGIAAQLWWDDVAPFDEVDFVVGEYVLVEQNLADEASAFVAQLVGTRQVSEDTRAKLAVGWYLFSNTAPDGDSTLVADNQGNALTGGAFDSEFSILNPIFGITCDRWSQPVIFGAEYMHNLDATGTLDTGYAAGIGVGRKKAKGDWYGYYSYSMIEQDAIFSPFANDDFLLATNTEGHVGGVKYRVSDKAELHLWTLVSARDEPGTTPTTDSDQEQWRARIDLNVSF